MIQAVKQYRKKLSKELHCTRATKKRLLDEFDKLLLNYAEDTPSPTAETLTSAFGTAKDMADTLMESVTVEETVKYNKHQFVKKVFSIILTIAVIIFVIYVFFWMRKPLVMVDENKELCVNLLPLLKNI